VGFDWEEPHQVWDKVEELEELQVEVEADQDKLKLSLGMFYFDDLCSFS
jgi:XTP/dITP diphosphohydrolase